MKNDLQITSLHSKFDKLQKQYGDKSLDSIYGAGCINNPLVCFVFINPTGRNIASDKNWKGIKAQWLGTKNIWKLIYNVGLLDKNIYNKTQTLKPNEWDYAFAEELYNNLKENKVYITNLGKCTQIDARSLSNKYFYDYLPLLEEEISIINPKYVITFGNQVSSLLLNENISVSKCRQVKFNKIIKNKSYDVYPVFYPVGQGMRNINISIEDIKEIIYD